jgi:hypothetical protein
MVLICFNGVEWMILIGPPFEDLFLWAFVAPVATLARRFFFLPHGTGSSSIKYAMPFSNMGYRWI